VALMVSTDVEQEEATDASTRNAIKRRIRERLVGSRDDGLCLIIGGISPQELLALVRQMLHGRTNPVVSFG
jgi:hypothetical protein